MNYCTDQWLIVKYPGGAGGKFLINALFLFDQVPHWLGDLNQEETVNYFKTTICNFQDPIWLNREINHQWGTNFFSRSYLRNNNITPTEFNQNIDLHATEYFKKCWNNNLNIVDHWGKTSVPKFWENAKTVDIIIDDYDTYQEFLANKLYRIEDDRIISLLDVPSTGTADNQHNVSLFNNQYEFFDISWDDFFETHIKQLSWLAPWLDYTPTGYYVTLTELINRDTFIEKFKYFENLYQQTIPIKYLIELHDTWTLANEHQYKLRSTR